MRGIGDERQAMYPWKTRMNKNYAALFIANAKRTARDTIVIHWTDMRAETLWFHHHYNQVIARLSNLVAA
jgi:hypothetical protein